MNICVLFSLLLLLAPGGCPIYSIDLSTLEVPNDFQNELTLQSMLSSELHQYRNKLNSNEVSSAPNRNEKDQEQIVRRHLEDPFDKGDMMRSIEDRIKATYYAAATPEETDPDMDLEIDKLSATQPERCSNDEDKFLGTNLFGSYPKHCFSTEEIALMSARKDFELLVPRSYPKSLLSDSIIYTLMKYFNSVNQVIKRMSDKETRRLLQRAFYDSLGGYLRYKLVPVAQVSYYAGRLKLCTVQRLVALYRQCLMVLNTNGNGWRQPEQDILSRMKNVRIKPVHLNDSCSTENDASSCALLDHSCANSDAQNEQMIVPLPHLELEDSSGFLSNIFLPFKHRRIYNLRSPDAAFILVKFFKTLSNCYRFQGMSQKIYNHKLRVWIRENLQFHYRDEMFYPGLGGVLQIYETLICPTKVTEHSTEEEERERMLSETDDYDLGPEDKSPSESSDMAEKSKKRKQKKSNRKDRVKQKDKETALGRKHSRSTSKLQNNRFAQEETKPEKDTNGEECVDCDDESYVGYAAAILALLLMLLLLLICCCMHRNRGKKKKRGALKPNKPEEKQYEDRNPPSATPSAAPNKAESERSCWSKMFQSKKSRRQQGNAMFPPRPHSMPFKHAYKLSPGMSLVSSHRDEVFNGSIDMENQLPRKEDAVDRYENDSFTSTSSLVCQFPRKFIPIKMGREKRYEYYGKTDKKRVKPVSKQSSSQWHRERDRDRDRDREREQEHEKKPIAEKHVKQSPEARSRETDIRLTTDESLRKMNNKRKYRRQEGGLATSQERVERVTEREIRPIESDTNRNSDCRRKEISDENKLESEKKCSGTTNSYRAEPNISVSQKPETQTGNSEIKSIPLSLTDRSSGVCELGNHLRR
ncbi:uncharacterized protein Dvir_GJ10524, isoform C [Drosophila virilis]|uniref:Uncharacterized protein, isoform C n=1 Tax=Drosophila virilis TaxID=7244 RepID=A0A0Q9W0X4_DROVI|nr:uncharacterized protein Dvir_GJ10524, isoform C [Drosophila virilis]